MKPQQQGWSEELVAKEVEREAVAARVAWLPPKRNDESLGRGVSPAPRPASIGAGSNAPTGTRKARFLPSS